MAKNIRYSLDIPSLENLVNEFGDTLGDTYTIVFDNLNRDNKAIKISKEGDKKSSILRCYIVNGGQVSFRNEGSTTYYAVCNQCRDYLVENGKLEFADRKAYTVSHVSEDEFLSLIDCLGDGAFGYTLEKKDINCNNALNCAYTIKGKYKDEITVNYYKNGTMFMQGRISPVFIDFACQATGLLTDSSSQLEALFTVEKSKIEIIDEDLKKHIPVNYTHIEGKLETILSSSLLLINNPIKLNDYSAYAFPALRALEGLMRKRIVEECGAFSDFGVYFDFNYKNKEYKLKSDSRPFHEKTCHCLEKAYNLFKKHRDSTFHMDSSTETSRTLELNESIEIVQECLKIMSALCENWN